MSDIYILLDAVVFSDGQTRYQSMSRLKISKNKLSKIIVGTAIFLFMSFLKHAL